MKASVSGLLTQSPGPASAHLGARVVFRGPIGGARAETR